MIRIGFGTNNKLRSKLIRWATKSEWSHVWIEYQSELWGGDWGAHAHDKGVIKVPLHKIYTEYTKRKVYYCHADADLKRGFQWAANRVGYRYDYGVIWNGLLYFLYRLFGWLFLWKLVVYDRSEMTCSEFVAGFLKAAGMQELQPEDPELLPPGDLEKECLGSSFFSEVRRT